MQNSSPSYVATCHCKATRIEVDTLPDGVVSCNCTYCSKMGALWGYYPPSRVRFIREDAPGVYAPNTNKHHFCTVCGATTYSITPNWQREWQGEGAEDLQISLNIRLLEDVDIAAIPVVPIDGKTGWGAGDGE